LYYPIFIICTMIVIIVLMLVYIIPQLKQVFADSGATLPLATRMIIAISDFMVHYWWLVLGIVVVLIAGFTLLLRSREGGSWWDRVKIHIPIVSELYSLIYMARFCRTMSMLLQSGVPIMETIAITADVIQNRLYTESLKSIAGQVERGIPMSVPMQKDRIYPPIVSEMMMVGEQTGKVGQVLTRLAEYYEKETDTKIKGLSGLIEPVIIVIIGVGVGFLVFSVIYPIYSIAQTGM
jgi:type IV pilus assembly protein PilC